VSRFVIIGNSAAAIGAVEAIRAIDKKDRVIIVSDEPYHAYSRPLITYFLADKVTWPQMLYRPFDFYRHNDIETRLGQKATEIEPAKKEVILNTGERITYDKLLIATGGTPFVPPIKGSDKKGVVTFTTFDDAKRTQKLLSKVRQAVVIGGGLIGLKTAEALATKGIEVTVVELADRLLSLILDETASRLVKEIFEENKVKLITGQSVKEILGKEKVRGVILDNNEKLDCQLVIVAIGVVPRKELAEGAGLKTDRGIIVDEHQRTSVKDIFAAGDVTETFDLVLETTRPIPIWPNAYLQGWTAGMNMAGRETKYEGSFSMNSVTFFGHPIISAGLTSLPATTSKNGYQELTKKDLEQRTYRKLVLKNDVVQGFVACGEIDRAGIITQLIKEKNKVTGFKKKLVEDPFGLIVFPKDIRKKLLKGEVA
jgi:NAD(P)H-nitrite reductase large subunit